MNKYQTYKSSGVEWIGLIPEHWSITKIKYTKKDSKDSFIDGDWVESKDLSEDGIRYITSGNIGEGKYKEQGSGYISEDTFKELNCTEIFEGDLIISRLFLPVGRSCILPNLNKRVITCVDNVVLRPKDKFNKYYLNYQFNSNRYTEFTELISRGVTLTRISRGMLGNNSIVVPPLEEQQQIVQFLDEKTELIDKLISTKERKITLLKEQRTSLINQVVTKGLNPNVKMKDSGVEWIGDIPEHWITKKIKWLCNTNTVQISQEKLNEIELIHYSIPNVQEFGTGILENGSDIDSSKLVVRGGEILFSKLNPRKGTTCIVKPNNDYLIVCSGEFISLIPYFDISKYIFYIISNQSFIEYIDSMVESVTRSHQRVRPEKFLSSLITVPPINEQFLIVEYIESKTKEIDDMISLEQTKIDLLKEYRQSLISEVITGKIKVTTDE